MDWGYSINKPRVMAYDDYDRAKAEELLAAIPALRACIGCGNCTAACTAGNLVDFNIRNLQIRFRRGEYDGISRDIDKCMLCGKCKMVCPRGINTRKMIISIKRLLAG